MINNFITDQRGHNLSDSCGDCGKVGQEGGHSDPGQEGHRLPHPDDLQGHGEGCDRGADAPCAGQYPGQTVAPGRGHHASEQVALIRIISVDISYQSFFNTERTAEEGDDYGVSSSYPISHDSKQRAPNH